MRAGDAAELDQHRLVIRGVSMQIDLHRPDRWRQVFSYEYIVASMGRGPLNTIVNPVGVSMGLSWVSNGPGVTPSRHTFDRVVHSGILS